MASHKKHLSLPAESGRCAGMNKAASQISHWLIVLLISCAWFAISNHCVIGATASEAKPAPSACPFHAKRTAPQKKSTDSPCCKILRATVAAKTKKIASPLVDLLFTEMIVFAPPTIFFGSETLDTGPPGKTSFVELIGSMRAHAPPLFA